MSDKRFELTRRKALAGLGGIGLASAGAGLGTTAYLNDTESFTGNSVQAGELNLVVDYETSVDQEGVTTGSNLSPSGTVDGDDDYRYEYSIVDAKPGDSGSLVFCPKVVDNPGWVWVGSDGLTDYENGQTEPEAEADASGGGSLGSSDTGADAGELSHAIQVTVSYCEDASGSNKRTLNNPDDYTLADLLKDLESGFLLDGDQPDGDADADAYPGSTDTGDQQGPCLCIEWDIPTSVGNEIQSDAVEFDFQFQAVQERHNGDPPNPFVDAIVSGGSIQDAIDAASTGDVIMVESGMYDEQVTVDKTGLLLFSPDPSSTTITDQVIVSAGGATLCGFTVSPPAAPQNSESEAIRVSNTPDGVTIVNNIVENFQRDGSATGFWGTDGINVFGGSSSDPIENVVIRDNTVRNVYNAYQAGSTGISIQGNVDRATVKDNTITEIGVNPSGDRVNNYGFGVVLRGSGNHSILPRNVNVLNNDIGTVLSDTSSQYLGVGLGVESDGTNYLARDNTIDDVNIGVEIKEAATELTFVDNSLSNIDGSNTGNTQLYFGDQDGDEDSPIASIIADNTFDQAVAAGGPLGPYDQTIQPAP